MANNRAAEAAAEIWAAEDPNPNIVDGECYTKKLFYYLLANFSVIS
jgi:hypothetical protein